MPCIDMIDIQETERLYKKLLEQSHCIKTINALLSQSLDVPFILEGIAKEILDFLKVDRCLITRYGEQKELPTQQCGKGIHPINLAEISSIFSFPIETRPLQHHPSLLAAYCY